MFCIGTIVIKQKHTVFQGLYQPVFFFQPRAQFIRYFIFYFP
ncbi:MAG: hypothetical protein JWQ23_3117 [Herminiimonas sp.]|nr:hypothetical protein [Herminiimonas sp.]